jgi:hypothetical protein
MKILVDMYPNICIFFVGYRGQEQQQLRSNLLVTRKLS